MKLNRNSLLNRFNTAVGEWDWGKDTQHTNDFCEYLWSSVWNGLLALATSLAGFFFLTLIGSASLEALFAPVELTATTLTYHWVFGGVTLVIMALLVIAFICVLSSPFYLFYILKRECKIGDIIKNSGVIQYLKGKKNKHCPRIDWED